MLRRVLRAPFFLGTLGNGADFQITGNLYLASRLFLKPISWRLNLQKFVRSEIILGNDSPWELDVFFFEFFSFLGVGVPVLFEHSHRRATLPLSILINRRLLIISLLFLRNVNMLLVKSTGYWLRFRLLGVLLRLDFAFRFVGVAWNILTCGCCSCEDYEFMQTLRGCAFVLVKGRILNWLSLVGWSHLLPLTRSVL